MLEATGTAKFQVWPFAFKPNPFHMRCLSFQEALEQPHRQGHICFLFLAPILGVLANRLSPAVAQTLGSTLLPSALSWLPVPWNTKESCSLKVIEALHSLCLWPVNRIGGAFGGLQSVVRTAPSLSGPHAGLPLGGSWSLVFPLGGHMALVFLWQHGPCLSPFPQESNSLVHKIDLSSHDCLCMLLPFTVTHHVP